MFPMYGLERHVQILKGVCDATVGALRELPTPEPHAQIAESMLTALRAEVAALVELSQYCPTKEPQQVPAVITEEAVSRLVGTNFMRRVEQLRDVAEPVIRYCVDAAELLVKRVDTGNYPLQMVAQSARRSACSLRGLLLPVEDALIAARLRQVIEQAATAAAP